MNPDTIQRFGDELHQSLIDRKPVPPLSERDPSIGVDDAYRIQLRMIRRRLDEGETVIGKKISVTSEAVQRMLQVYQPDFGQLLSGMVYCEGQPIPVNTLIAPRAEAELEGLGVSAADVLRATDYVLPCFEIVDSRIQDWRIKIQDTVADNASCGVFVLGGTARSLRGLDLSVAVPGYTLVNGPIFDGHRVSIFMEVEGLGDYLQKYAGNLDIMTAAAARTAEIIAANLCDSSPTTEAA
jgi:2-oxopent-4-enoate/cis-2-oxohex-4-enoate hydratase